MHANDILEPKPGLGIGTELVQKCSCKMYTVHLAPCSTQTHRRTHMSRIFGNAQYTICTLHMLHIQGIMGVMWGDQKQVVMPKDTCFCVFEFL